MQVTRDIIQPSCSQCLLLDDFPCWTYVCVSFHSEKCFQQHHLGSEFYASFYSSRYLIWRKLLLPIPTMKFLMKFCREFCRDFPANSRSCLTLASQSKWTHWDFTEEALNAITLCQNLAWWLSWWLAWLCLILPCPASYLIMVSRKSRKSLRLYFVNCWSGKLYLSIHWRSIFEHWRHYAMLDSPLSWKQSDRHCDLH